MENLRQKDLRDSLLSPKPILPKGMKEDPIRHPTNNASQKGRTEEKDALCTVGKNQVTLLLNVGPVMVTTDRAHLHHLAPGETLQIGPHHRLHHHNYHRDAE